MAGFDELLCRCGLASNGPPGEDVFTDKAGQMHFSAERYLINRLREKFGFEGTPIVVKTKRR